MRGHTAAQRPHLQFRAISRRTLLLAGAGIALTPVAASCQKTPTEDSPVSAPAGPEDEVRPRPLLTALHVHANFSEGPGSMQAQLAQAQQSGYDVLWWTEHDWRMAAHGYLSRLAVDGSPDSGITWRRSEESTGEHRVVQNAPPHPSGGTIPAVRIRTEASEGIAECRILAESSEHLYRTSLHGQEWTVLVHPAVLQAGSLGLDLRTSWRPASANREEGFYWLSYRFGASATTTVRERRAEIGLQAQPGAWTEFTLRPVDDFTSAWPDLDGRDASCVEVSLLAEAQAGGSADGYFADLSIARSESDGETTLAVQRELMDRYAGEYPTVQQLQGLEVSAGTPHVCWYGGQPRIDIPPEDPPLSRVDEIRASGGVASYAHPFGVGGQPPPTPAPLAMVAPVLETVLDSGVRECDALEVGYRQRGGATLSLHESLWDALSRRGHFLTGLGVNDDHVGRAWAEPPNNFGSWLCAPTPAAEDLTSALRSGYVYFGDPALFSGRLDLLPSPGGRMGNVLLDLEAATDVRIIAEEMPRGSSVELLRLEMAQDAAPMAVEQAVSLTIPQVDLGQGTFTTTVDTTRNCLVRTRVVDSSGEVIALSNPVWFITDPATYPVPEYRRVSPQPSRR